MKSQSATEFIIILGIIMVILGIVVLQFFSLPTQQDQNIAQFWSNNDVAVQWSADNSDLLLRIQNNMDQSITIQKIEVDGRIVDQNATTLSVGEQFSRIVEHDQTKTVNELYVINLKIHIETSSGVPIIVQGPDLTGTIVETVG